MNDDYLDFLDVKSEYIVNVVPLDECSHIPRTGDLVYLPGIEEDEEGGLYKVLELRFAFIDNYSARQPTRAKPAGITAMVVPAEEVSASQLGGNGDGDRG